MHINQLKDSKFLKKEDCGQGILVTIKGLTQENIAMEGQAQEMVWLLHFMENVKPLVFKPVNQQLTALAVGSEETDDWIGKKIVLFHDPTITMSGKIVGGIRVRAPRNQAPKPVTTSPPQPAPMPHVERQTAQAEDSSDDPPF